MAANVYASATDGGSGGGSAQPRSGTGVRTAGATIDCPDVGSRLTSVPERARPEVDRELARLDEQIAQAYQRLSTSAPQIRQDSGFADSAIMNPLKDKRAATIERIAIAIDRVADRPEGLAPLAACTVRDSGNQAPAPTASQGGGEQPGQGEGGQDQGNGQGQGGNGGQAGNGPVAADFADIRSVRPDAGTPRQRGGASRGSFATDCGVNANGLFNSDNIIAAPGVTNGAHHFHDYVGNQANNAFASDQDLANAETSCADPGDKSSYYWPVLRLQNGTQEQDATSPGGGIEGNAGEIVTPKQVTLTFVGNPRDKVTAMPRLLRIITGDAKSFVNGLANANASWSCTGFEDRQLKDKYPLCPRGSDVVRTFTFQSCWDGRNIDSANHRTHVAFANAAGTCPSGFRPIPQLVQRIVYDVDAPSLDDGGRTTPLFAVDSFPEQLHKPVTDHGDFINVFDEDLMREMVDCINEGRRCGAGAGAGPGGEQPGAGEEPQEQPTGNPDAPQEEPTGTPEAPQEQPTRTPDAPKDGNAGGKPGDAGAGGGKGEASKPPVTGRPAPEPEPGDDATTAPGTGEPEVYATPSAERGTANAGERGGADGDAGEDTDGLGGSQAVGTATSAAPTPSDPSRTEPQAVGEGGLADTGAQLWPAAAGAVLVAAGFLVLRRARRG
ncbi:membrane protein [Streptomyces olindensis]|nr:membrane protein [Streptomyces olindensis]